MNTMTCRLLFFQSIFLSCITPIQVKTFATIITSDQLAANQTDHISLQAFKSKISHDPQGVLNSWNDSLHFCDWEGVTCSSRHRRVRVLELSSRALIGSLSPYIGNLSFLRKLDLANNSIQGQIPPEFGNLFRLEDLQLHNNALVGEIQANLSHCSRLKFLFLGYNQLVGKIPPEFVSLWNLKVITLHYNSLTGGIPPFLGNLTSLEVMSIADNDFGGTIPDSLGRLKKLTTLGLGENNLSGEVPSSLYNLSFLVNFSLPFNQLQGSLPSNLGLTLPRLKLFQLSYNLFDGSIPVSLSNASELERILMENNGFSGKLSVNFGRMQQLEVLNVYENSLGSGEMDEMNFVNSLANCSNLRSFHIGQNQFTGELLHSIANLSTKLENLRIYQNQLYGTIPSGISNLVNLDELVLYTNQLSGKIPKEIGKLQKLRYMDLSDNKFSGEIPSSLGNLTTLTVLDLSYNRLSGVIPSSVGNWKQLNILDLYQNNLTGIIPKQIFDITSLSISLSLAQNQLVGSLPPNIGNLQALSTLDLTDNYLSGTIPSELSLCSSLEYLYLGGNFFHGFIPSSLSSLTGVRDIDFSLNNLSGQIPKFLETLTLENLNLSFNNFEGEVPTKGIFTNVSAISVVGNSDQLCGGVAALQLPKCANNESKEEKISRLFKILISIGSAFLGLAMMSFFIFCWLKNRRGKQPFEPGTMLMKELLNVSYERLLNATEGFSSTCFIGVGSFGSVYKGILDQDRTAIAIKVLNLQRQGASKSFMAECKALRNIRHRNLVKVITSCSSIDFQGNDFKAIVYEYMPNGSLEKWLYPAPETEEEQPGIQNLTLLTRISIAIDVASAIDYLHNHCQEPIIHCDLKPSNVLLDSEMTAKVGDFGLARFLPEVTKLTQSSSLGVRGTIGYAAPEYGLGSEVSTNGYVYSYGILLLEMMTRKRPTDLMFEGSLNLHNFARMAFPERVMDIVDPELLRDEEDMAAANQNLRETRNNYKRECLISMMRIGVACSMESRQDRMNITDVVHELQSIRNVLLKPTTRFNRQGGLRS